MVRGTSKQVKEEYGEISPQYQSGCMLILATLCCHNFALPGLANEPGLVDTITKNLGDKTTPMEDVECIVWILRRVCECSEKQAKKIGLNQGILKLFYARMLDRIDQEHEPFLRDLRNNHTPQVSISANIG